FPVEKWDYLLNVNVRPTFIMSQIFRPALAASHGSIVAVSSMSGVRPHRGSGAYSPAKAALSMLCKVIAQEWAPQGIRANAVAPGMIRTPLTKSIYENDEVTRRRIELVPLGRIGTPEDIAAVVSFLAGPDSAYVTGQVLLADGGITDAMLGLIPGLPKP
ncbi:SDR family NAD(P)-dependent oxidoreductase, partial [Devosia sp.]|uniref:SDR family NAD(P)-dependent oxidoreductase n=1 Tax=Devosia sp. TaxID=1871048 RepID=UPI002F031F7E